MNIATEGILVGITGGREYAGRGLADMLDAIHYGPRGPIRMLVHGCARGADTIADQWAARRGITRQPFPAFWRVYGKAAGHRRNQQMVDFVAGLQGPKLWVCAPGGRGTADCRRRVEKAGIELVETG